MLRGKVAWITGGGSGIGLAGAIELARAGAHVVISGRNEKTLKEGLAKVKAAGSADAMLLDVSHRDEIFRTAEKIGKVDILVTSAGVNSPKRNYRNVSLQDWESIVAINLHGVFYCIQAVLPGMRERKDGVVINIASWFGKYWNTLGGPGYNSTKHAVVSLTETLNVEECANGIRATAILPGEVATPILEKRPVPPSQAERARMLQPDDLGKSILFVASLPPSACVNELVISPTWNRFFLGGLEAPKT